MGGLYRILRLGKVAHYNLLCHRRERQLMSINDRWQYSISLNRPRAGKFSEIFALFRPMSHGSTLQNYPTLFVRLWLVKNG